MRPPIVNTKAFQEAATMLFSTMRAGAHVPTNISKELDQHLNQGAHEAPLFIPKDVSIDDIRKDYDANFEKAQIELDKVKPPEGPAKG